MTLYYIIVCNSHWKTLLFISYLDVSRYFKDDTMSFPEFLKSSYRMT